MIMDDVKRVIYAEQRASGMMPLVVILGEDDYDTLYGELKTLFNVTLPQIDKYKFDEYYGCIILKSYSFKQGIFAGVNYENNVCG
jgi:hypothetical protein